MEEEKTKPVIVGKEDGITQIFVVLDSSVLFSFLNEKDVHHLTVESALGAIKPYKPSICISVIVLLETMGKLIRECRLSVSKAKALLKNKMAQFDTRFEKIEINYEYIIDKYESYAKSNVSKLKAMDFYIVAEAIGLNATLLTCDKEMYDKAKTRHSHIFYLGNPEKTQISGLIKHIEKEYNTNKKKNSARPVGILKPENKNNELKKDGPLAS